VCPKKKEKEKLKASGKYFSPYVPRVAVIGNWIWHLAWNVAVI
jgi:hypothetical protein